MKVAICHDYLFQFGGAERCVESWLEMYPNADIYSSFSIPEKFKDSVQITKAFEEGRVQNSFLQGIFRFKFAQKFQKHLFWIYPIAMSFLRVKDYDLVIVSATYCGKNIKLQNNQKVIFYCYTPTRFLYGFVTETDQKMINPILRKLIPFFTKPLRILDQKAAKYLTRNGAIWVAISKYIQDNIKIAYGVDSQIIYPPVETEQFTKLTRKADQIEDFYIYFGRISFHKRIDLAILACLNLGKKLVIVGASSFQPEMDKLKDIVKNHPNKELITFAGRVSDIERNNLLQKAKAMIFTAKEDFGIAPVEAIAACCPVIGYGSGGALEYIQPGVNGTLFEEQSMESLQEAITNFEKMEGWNVENMRKSVQKFASGEFKKEFERLIK
jgi:glycosyltransferase involved in cell wall biosynthesis